MIIYLLRHGESESNSNSIFAAKKVDLPLTQLGIQQAVLQARRLKNAGFVEIFSSPLLRARHTAEIVGRSCGISSVIADELSEVDVGLLDGKNMEDPHNWGIWEKVLGKWRIRRWIS
jgi:probable phosphoglycerate mutase